MSTSAPLLNRISSCLVGITLCLLAQGCASSGLKGTPFYSDTETVVPNHTDERVSLWPLVYYRPPVWSFLWPILEGGPEYLTVRPIYSVHTKNGSNRVTDVVWPIAHWGDEDNRVFPVFWGDDYKVIVPFYWRFGDPFSENEGSLVIPPLYSFRRTALGTESHYLWPFVHSRNMEGHRSYGVWPFYGYEEKDNLKKHYYAWPLGWSWRSGEGIPERQGSVLFPVYLRWSHSMHDGFVSPLWWNVSRSSDTRWGIPLLATWGTETDTSHDRWIFGPLIHHQRDQSGNTWSHALPFYLHEKTQYGGRFISLPWSSGVTSNGTTWSVAPPFVASWKLKDGQAGVVSPLGWLRRDHGGVHWGVIPMASVGYENGSSHDRWLLGPIIRHKVDENNNRSSHVLPLYYHSRTSNESLFVSLPWSKGRRSNGTDWQFIPPVFYRSSGPRGNGLITPVYARGSSIDGDMSWDSVIPLYFRQTSSDGTLFATVVGGWKSRTNGHSWLIYPLLTHGRTEDRSSEMWVLAPLFRMKREEDRLVSMHALPLFWWNGESRLFLSPLAARWEDSQARDVTLAPLLLSAMRSSSNRFDIYAALGLAHGSWGGSAGSSHVVPFYYRNPVTDTFVSPVYSAWNNASGTRTRLLPLLATWTRSEVGQTNVHILGSLMHWGNGPSSSRHVFPLFYRDDKGTLVTIPWVQWTDGTTRNVVIPPLLSGYRETDREKKLTILLGLGEEVWGASWREGYLFPIYTHKSNRYFYTPLFGRKSDPDRGFYYPFTPLLGVHTGRMYSGSWCFPLYSTKKDRVTGDRSLNYLLLGHYNNHENGTVSRFLPLFTYSRSSLSSNGVNSSGKTEVSWWSLPWVWYKNGVTSHSDKDVISSGENEAIVEKRRTFSHGCFPLWSYASVRTPGTEDVSKSAYYLCYLGAYKKRVETLSDGSSLTNSTSSFLWKVWHRERRGDSVSTDIFPGITYDKVGESYKSTSFLWRVFRYERKGNSRRVHVLFIPVWRSKAAPLARSES